MAELAGKKALVTGGGSGVAANVARRLAAHGAQVVLTCHRSSAQAALVVDDIVWAGGQAHWIAANLTDPAVAQAMVSQAVDELGGLDILVNAAALGPNISLEKSTIEQTSRLLDLNLRGAVLTCQAALGHLPRGGRIITIGRGRPSTGPAGDGAVDALSRAAMIAFTKTLAQEVEPRGISVNIIHPGREDASRALDEGRRGGMAFLNHLAPHEAPDLPGAVVFLASDIGYAITGAALTIDLARFA